MPVSDAGPHTVRVRQYVNSAPTNYFYTNYEINLVTDVDIIALDAFADSLQQFHSLLQRPDIFSDKVTFSTYTPDSEPYDANESHSYENTVQGLYAPALAGDIAPLEVCLKIKRRVATGNNGNIALRGALYQGQYKGSGSTMIANNVSGEQLRVLEAFADSGLTDNLNASENPIKLAMIGTNSVGTIIVRNLIGIAFQKIGSVNVSKRYFDKP